MARRKREIRSTAQPKARNPRGRDQESALSGALANVSLATVLTIFEMERRSGTVSLHAGRRSGQIGFLAGQVVSARVAGGAGLHGREALFALLDWHDGRFDYQPDQVPAIDEMRSTTSHLLLEAARRYDEVGLQASTA